MIERKNTGALIIIFLILLFSYCLAGLISETRSRAKILNNEDILMFSANENESVLDFNLSDEDSLSCKTKASDLISKFDPYTIGLENVTIHHRLDLRRGLASSNKIWIRCLKDIEEFENIFLHELGHIVAHNYIADEDEQNFYNIGGKSISEYGQEKVEEDFAESFLMYIKHGNEYRQIILSNNELKSKYEFIKYKIFDGYEFNMEEALNREVLSQFTESDYYPYDISILFKS